MASTSEQGKIEYVIGLPVRGPIVEGNYSIDDVVISVSYPLAINLGLPAPIQLPISISSLFVVSWTDIDGKTAAKLRSKTSERTHPLLHALDKISKLLLAYKFTRIGHSDGRGIRTIGVGDTLFYFASIDGVPTGNLNLGIRLNHREYPWAYGHSEHHEDPHNTTELAKEHINQPTFPLARRFVRCFELLEHGFYTECFVIAFSIIDDRIQKMLLDLFLAKGMDLEDEAKALLRGIKENRLKLFTGPLLKLLHGKDIDEVWGDASAALKWINGRRNAIAHEGYSATYGDAAKAIYVCVKLLVVLWKEKLISDEIPINIYRHAKVEAAWAPDPLPWLPVGPAAEQFTYD